MVNVVKSQALRVVALAGMSFVLAGCECIGPMTPGKISWVQAGSGGPRVGNVYLLRAFVGLWSRGVDDLAAELRNAGVTAHVFQEDQADELARAIIRTYAGVPDAEPICLIGHSFGANDAVNIARQVRAHGLTVELLVAFDATDPPPVPGNVLECYNFYQPSLWDFTPFLRGVPMKQEKPGTGVLVNCNVRGERRDLLESNTNHINIAANPKIHRVVIDKLLSICVPRGQWIRTNSPAGR